MPKNKAIFQSSGRLDLLRQTRTDCDAIFSVCQRLKFQFVSGGWICHYFGSREPLTKIVGRLFHNQFCLLQYYFWTNNSTKKTCVNWVPRLAGSYLMIFHLSFIYPYMHPESLEYLLIGHILSLLIGCPRFDDVYKMAHKTRQQKGRILSCKVVVSITAYHGNPQPLFLGVITHNLGVEPSFFMVLGSKDI